MDCVAHTIFDLRGLEPYRCVVFVIGMTCLAWMLQIARWSVP